MRSDRFEVTVRGDLVTACNACKEIGEVFGRYGNIRIKRRFNFNYKTDELSMRFICRIMPSAEDENDD